jgi:putative FmdB family regulatory protein
VPTYQYACTACNHRLEAVQSFSDAAMTECPECSGRLRKVFSSVGIVFKGSGFYRTDSRAGSDSAVAKGESKSESNGSGSPSGSKDGASTSASGSSGSDSGSSGSDSGSSGSGSSGSSGSSSTPAAAAS